MLGRQGKRTAFTIAGLAAVVLLAAATAMPASGAASGGGPPRVTGPVGTQNHAGKAVKGGTLAADASIGEPLGLDPIKNTNDGDVGMTEYAAIYDVLVRYDPVERKYVPQLAKSLSANADHTVYTVGLRPNVKFTDGTPLDATAVKFSVDRFKSGDSIQYYFSVLPEIASVDTPDDLTVVFTLTTPDEQFPWMLTQGLGLVVSPTAVQQKGEEAFNLAPVGAGPFKVSKYTPGQDLEVVRNPDYWGPAPYLDGIHFTWPANDKAKVQALGNGDLDMIHVLDPAATQSALEQGFGGNMWLRYGGGTITINQREGHHASDVKVRQAIAYAVNPTTINTRVFAGKGYASSDLFPSGTLSSGVSGLPYKPAKARSLLQDVKQTSGWDGSISLLASNDASQQAAALTVQALLNKVGFDVKLDTAPSISAFVNDVYVNYDYDLAITALNVSESDPWAQLVQEVSGSFNPNGYQNPDMDAALTQLQAAATPAETKAATAKMQRVWNQTVPEVWYVVGQDTVLGSKKLNGVVPSSNATVLLGKAWLAK
jgi:peptide/nickel transport system substrate-binding protein